MRIGAAVVGCHRRGGIERVALETVNALAARGHDVELVSYKIDQQAVNQRVRTHELTEPWGPRLRAAVAFPGKAERAFHDLGPLDVRCGFGSLSVPGSVVWVTSVHARWLEVVDQGEVAPSLKRKLNPFHPLMLRQERQQYAPGYHRRLLAMSPSIIDDLQRFCQSRPDDIQQLPHGYDVNTFSLQRALQLRESKRLSLGFRRENRIILTVANEIPRKGVPNLFRALTKLDNPNVCLLLVGKLDSRVIKQLAKDAGVDSNRYRIHPSTDDIAPFYAAADVLALPTLYDAWGLVIVEALACGCPVVTTSRAGASTVVIEKTTGSVLRDPWNIDALAEEIRFWLERDSIDRRAIAESVEYLAWEGVIERYESVLVKVAEMEAIAV